MKKYRVTLSKDEREYLVNLTSNGLLRAREMIRAMILLRADENQDGGAWTDDAISKALRVHSMTVTGLRKRYVERGMVGTLERAPTGHNPAKLDGTGEAHLIALTCSEPPAGHEHWTLQLLANQMVKLKYVDAISSETVRQVLKKTNSSHG
jgi:transposase